jgi:hypothetical protein
MANVPYNYLNQPMLATALIQGLDSDSFYFPEANGHNGYAFNGVHYTNGVQTVSPPIAPASWYREAQGPYRGTSTAFPVQALVLLGRASLVILDETTQQLNLWMTFLLGDNLLLANNFATFNPNFSSDLQGYLPSGLTYANGVISVIYSPDPGAEDIGFSPPMGTASNMVVNIDFTQDTAYLDIAT